MSGAYYCEICRTTVDWNAKTCPSCGASFSGVLCPKCGKLGSGSEFLDGCPRCGNSRERNLVGKAKIAVPQKSGKHGKARRPWRPSLYWLLSLLLIAAVGIIASYWLKS